MDLAMGFLMTILQRKLASIQFRQSVRERVFQSLFDFQATGFGFSPTLPTLKVLIQKLIERLLTEARNEATHKGWCDTEIGKAEKDREYRHADSVKLNAAITEGEATIAKLKETIATLTKELEELNEALLEATKQRNQEKANNKKTLTDAKEGLTALKQAIKVLTDYYKGAAKSKNRYEGGGYEGAAFVQASPVAEQMGAEGVQGGAKGAYAGNQAAGAGIIGMLETIA